MTIKEFICIAVGTFIVVSMFAIVVAIVIKSKAPSMMEAPPEVEQKEPSFTSSDAEDILPPMGQDK